MRKKHGKDLTESVMPGHASQTSCVMQNMHDTCCTFPDPDIFPSDNGAGVCGGIWGEDVVFIRNAGGLVLCGRGAVGGID